MIKKLVLSLLALTMVVLTPIGMANASNDDEHITIGAFVIHGLSTMGYVKHPPQWFTDYLKENPDFSQKLDKKDPSISMEITKAQALEITDLYADDMMPLMYTPEELAGVFSHMEGLEKLSNLEHIGYKDPDYCSGGDEFGLTCYPFSREQIGEAGGKINEFFYSRKDTIKSELPKLEFKDVFFPPVGDDRGSYLNPLTGKVEYDFTGKYGKMWGELVDSYRYKWDLINEINTNDESDPKIASTERYLFDTDNRKESYDNNLAEAKALLEKIKAKDFSFSQDELNKVVANTTTSRVELQGSIQEYKERKVLEISDAMNKVIADNHAIGNGLDEEWQAYLEKWKADNLSKLQSELDQLTTPNADTKAKIDALITGKLEKVSNTQTISNDKLELLYQKAYETEQNFLKQKTAANGVYTEEKGQTLNGILDNYNSLRKQLDSSIEATRNSGITINDDLLNRIAALSNQEAIQPNDRNTNGVIDTAELEAAKAAIAKALEAETALKELKAKLPETITAEDAKNFNAKVAEYEQLLQQAKDKFALVPENGYGIETETYTQLQTQLTGLSEFSRVEATPIEEEPKVPTPEEPSQPEENKEPENPGTAPVVSDPKPVTIPTVTDTPVAKSQIQQSVENNLANTGANQSLVWVALVSLALGIAVVDTRQRGIKLLKR